MRAVLANKVQRIQKRGPGKKHERGIELAGQQREIVTAHPGDFVRGPFSL